LIRMLEKAGLSCEATTLRGKLSFCRFDIDISTT
jgi:hypothetical protein